MPGLALYFDNSADYFRTFWQPCSLHRLRAVSLFLQINERSAHVRERWVQAVRHEKRGRQPEKKKESIARPNEIRIGLTTQNTTGWCVKRWQQTVNNRNHWQVYNGWSTAGMFVPFPEKEGTLSFQNGSLTLERKTESSIDWKTLALFIL